MPHVHKDTLVTALKQSKSLLTIIAKQSNSDFILLFFIGAELKLVYYKYTLYSFSIPVVCFGEWFSPGLLLFNDSSKPARM